MSIGFRLVQLTLLFIASVSTAATLSKSLVQQEVERIQADSGLVALGAVVVRGGDIQALAASGGRKIRSGVLVTPQDTWHIGSVTKSFTATMLARLVARGQLDWQMSIGDIFGTESNIHPDWHNVTLHQLLVHASGAHKNFSIFVHMQFPSGGLVRMKAREDAVLDVLSKPPRGTVGKEFTYSNIGYTIAGVMAEKVTGKPWEVLMKQEVFEPLGLRSAGFGAPVDTGSELSQPRGHRTYLGVTVASDMEADNTPIIGPAGTLHMTLTDLATYANEHLAGAEGRGKLMSAEHYRELHDPYLQNYAMGWLVNETNGYGLGDMLWHNGSNTRWYTLLVLFPQSDTAIAVVANDGRIEFAQSQAWALIDQLAPLLQTHQN